VVAVYGLQRLTVVALFEMYEFLSSVKYLYVGYFLEQSTVNQLFTGYGTRMFITVTTKVRYPTVLLVLLG
jgi:hypothetical protein